MAILGFILGFIFLAWMTVGCVFTIFFINAIGVGSRESIIPAVFLLLSFVGWFFLFTNSPFSISVS